MTSFKKVKFPFQRRFVTLLGSCNGLVFVVDENDVHSFRVHVWNPLTGFVKELPIPGFSTDFDLELRAYGVGYLPATDEYKVILSYAPVEVELDVNNETEEEYNRRVEEDEKLNFSKVMSLNDGIWRSIEAPKDCYSNHQQGTLVNGWLQWLQTPLSDEIVAFDLAREEFREIEMPNFGPKKIRDLSELRFCFVGCLEGCLCVLRYPVIDACDSIDFWVMREYGVVESWTKLFTFRFSNPEWSMRPLLITENSTVALKWNADIWSRNVFSADASTGVRISHKQEGEEEPCVNILGGNWDNVIEYEEGLASIGGYNGVHHNASQS
ncbi:PREDICTED: F-box/kelch-repeat protein At3g06240-like [Fragaria vesca subsp. vesca]